MMKKSTGKGFIYFRYIFPIAAAILLIALMFVPCYRFITADTGVNQAISHSTLMGNAWDQVRGYLFGGGEKQIATLDFSRAVLTAIIVLTVLFTVGFASTVYAAVSAFRFFSGGCRDGKSRALFITLVPNRAVLCIYHALMLPMLSFALLMPWFYDSFMNYHVQLAYAPFDMLYVAIAIYAATVIVIVVSARYERLEGMDLFFKHREKEEDNSKTEDESLPTDSYSVMDRMAREEQAERIRELLMKRDKENTTKEEDE